MRQILKYSSRLSLITMLILGGFLYKENQKLIKELVDTSFEAQTSNQVEGINCSVGKYPELPLVVLNLKGNTQKKNYLRLQLAVELFRGAEKVYITEAPKLYDRFNVLLTEKNVSYFNQENYTVRLKEELMNESENILGINVIKEILYKKY